MNAPRGCCGDVLEHKTLIAMMRYIQPSELEEMQFLENEVTKEMDEETSFTTQRRVYHLLIDDIEAQNVSLTNELASYRETIQERIDILHAEIGELRRDLGSVDTENKQLHEMLVFFGNQLNRRPSVTSLQSTSSGISTVFGDEDSSILLENIMDDLQNSTSCNDNVSKRRVDAAVEIIQNSISNLPTSEIGNVPTPDISTNVSSGDVDDDDVDKIVEALADTIIARDRFLEVLVNEIETHQEHICLLQKQTEYYNSGSLPMDTEQRVISTLAENIALKDRLLEHQKKRIDTQEKQIIHLKSELNETSEVFDTNNTFRSHRPIDRGIRPSTLAPWDQHNNGFATRALGNMGYSGGGLGKRGEGIIEPIQRTSPSPTHRNGIGSPPRVDNDVDPWRRNTTLIVGDSILSGVEETKLQRYSAKVRVFSGARIDDMYDYLKPLLSKMPTNIILHVGTNDAPTKSGSTMFEELGNLKKFINHVLPDANVYLSTPTIRVDNQKANYALRDLTSKMKASSFNIIDNSNVVSEGVGKKGLHLNDKGSGRLALNFINLMKRV